MAATSLGADLVQRNALSVMSFFAFLLAFMTIRYYRTPWRKLPPGLRGLPLLGNLHQMIHKRRWITFSQWHKIYGPVFYLNAAGQPIIVLGSLKVAADLLDRRASIYSDRPRNIVASDMIARGMSMPFMHFNDLWKRMRKASHEDLKNSAASKYHLIQLQEARILTEKLLSDEKEWTSHFERAAAIPDIQINGHIMYS